MSEPSSSSSTAVLVFNAGSSSLKMAIAEPNGQMQAEGVIRGLGLGEVSLQVSAGSRISESVPPSNTDYRTAVKLLLEALRKVWPEWSDRVDAVGHRVVHGGSLYSQPTLITTEVEHDLDRLNELAPLHNRRAVEVIREALVCLPRLPQVACFDTAFHADLPEETRRYALPRELVDRLGIRRYGFHGLSCNWSIRRLEALEEGLPERVIVCHLGAGASVTAIRSGKSFDTTMGFTPLEGLIMATRSGSVDPGILLFLLRNTDMDVSALEKMLENESGLLGLSGESGEVRVLEERAASGDASAEEALSAFAYAVRKAVGAYWSALGGLDALVLTAGIAEHSVQMRARILDPLVPLGIRVDRTRNSTADSANEVKLSSGSERPSIWLIPAHEELIIAAQVAEAVGAASESA